MAIPVRPQQVLLNGGKHEGISPLALVPMFNSAGSKNVRIVKPGIVRMINGYDNVNAAASSTDTGGSDAAVVGLYGYVKADGTRRVVKVIDDGVDEYEVWHSTDDGATWAFLRDLGAGAVGLVPSFYQFGDSLFLCFGGAIAVQEYNGTTCVDAGQTQPTKPTVVKLGGGVPGITGTFEYKTADIDASGNVGPSSPTSGKLTCGNNPVVVTPASFGANGARIYRTTGDGTTYFFLADLVSGTYTDLIDDRTLLSTGKEAPNSGEPPPAGSRFGSHHRNRPIVLGTDTYPDRFYYGDPGRGDSFGPDNWEKVGEGQSGDGLVCGWPEYEGIYIMFKEQSIWALDGDGRLTYNLDKTQAQAGTISKNSVELAPGGSKFRDTAGELMTANKPVLAYMTPHGDARVFDGISDTIISGPMSDTFATLSYEHRRQAWVQIYPPNNWIIFGIPTADKTFSYAALDYTQGTWHPVDFWPNLACAAITKTASERDVLLAGEAEVANTAFVYQLFTGTTANGADIEAAVRTIPLHHNNPLRNQVLVAMGSVFEAQASSLVVTLNIYNGMADTGASAFSTHSLELTATNAQFTTLDPTLIKDSSGEQPRGMAQVAEWTRTGSTIWGLAGWTSYRQDEMVPYAITT